MSENRLAEWNAELRCWTWSTYEIDPETNDLPVYHTDHAYVTLFEVDQHYGGPEEGGWWYTAGEPIAALPVFTPDEEEAARQLLRERFELDKDEKRYSYQQRYRLSTLANWPQAFPQVRPHYE
jgi:hypothetical protein